MENKEYVDEQFLNFIKDKDLGDKFLLFTLIFSEAKTKVDNFGTDQSFSPSEVHLIAAICDHPKHHITAIAELLGVTKGAVSQMVNKLVKREVLYKEEDPENRSKILVKPTELGLIVYKNHKTKHKNVLGLFNSLFDDLNENDKKAFHKVFNKALTLINAYNNGEINI